MQDTWSPTKTQISAIKEYTAKYLKIAPSQIQLKVGERYNIDTNEKNTNIVLISDDTDFSDTDLYDVLPFNTRTKIEAFPFYRDFYVDLYCYHTRTGELLTNTQVYGTLYPSGDSRVQGLYGTDSPDLDVDIA